MNLTAQKIILYMAIFFLIFLGIVIAFLLQSSKQLQNFPPELPGCPDYWENRFNPESKENECFNTHNLGSCSTTTFNAPEYQGESGKKKKCEWAKGCNIEWDGITNMGLC